MLGLPSTAFVESAACLCAAGLEALTDYEQNRLNNIARNNALLAEMGLGPGGPALLSAPPASRRPKRTHAELESDCAATALTAPVRRSSRVQNHPKFPSLGVLAAASDQLAAPSVAEQLSQYRPPLEEVASRPVAAAAGALVSTPEAPGLAPGVGQEAAALLHQMAGGLLCGVCQGEVKTSDARLECTSLRPNCEREYHHACVIGQFGHLYRTKEVAVPQTRDSRWRCMVCSDMCAVCVPAAKIGANQPFYRCGSCGAKAHQLHWRPEDVKMCVYCRISM